MGFRVCLLHLWRWSWTVNLFPTVFTQCYIFELYPHYCNFPSDGRLGYCQLFYVTLWWKSLCVSLQTFARTTFVLLKTLYMLPVSHCTIQHIEGTQLMLNTSPRMLNVLSSLVYISVLFVGLWVPYGQERCLRYLYVPGTFRVVDFRKSWMNEFMPILTTSMYYDLVFPS